MHPRTAFTLVELLVVIAIIVILLALLAPAMDQAMYQAELAVCGAKVRGIGLAATVYATHNKRSYPDRETYRNGNYKVNRPKRLWNATGNNNYFDQRRYIRPYVASINQQFQCPFLPEMNFDITDIQNRPAGELCNSSYQFWYGWQYSTIAGGANVPEAQTNVGGTARPSEKGMFKLGDRFSYTVNGRQYFFDVIANDHDLTSAPGTQPLFDNMTHGSHPDKYPKQTMAVLVQDEQLHWARWQGPYQRGLIDMNFARTDNSVQRFHDVVLERDPVDHSPDERMVRVPEGTADEWPGWRNTLPPAAN